MNRKTKWWIAGAVLGLTAIVAAGALTVQRRNAQEEAERKGAKPPLESMLAAMPVKVILNAEAGLLGAAVYAAQDHR